MSTGFSTIPVIDIGPLFGNDVGAQVATARVIGEAARRVGFFYVTRHGLPPALFDNLLDGTKNFFRQPIEKKMQVYIGNSRNHRGYVPEGEEVFYAGTKDAKEAYDLSRDLPADDPDYQAGNPLPWPQSMAGASGFRRRRRRLL